MEELKLRESERVEENINQVCDYCKKLFSTKQSKQTHIQIVHKDNKYKCEHCIKCFKLKDFLNMYSLFTS